MWENQAILRAVETWSELPCMSLCRRSLVVSEEKQSGNLSEMTSREALCFWGRSMREWLCEAQSHDSHLPTSGFNMASWEATVQDKRTKPESLSSIPVLPLLAEWPLLNHLTFSSLYFCTLSWIFLIQLVLRNQWRIACGVLWTSQSSGVAETRQY